MAAKVFSLSLSLIKICQKKEKEIKKENVLLGLAHAVAVVAAAVETSCFKGLRNG